MEELAIVEIPGSIPIADYADEAVEREHEAVMARFRGKPELEREFGRIEEEVTSWLRGEAVSRDELAAIARTETDAIMKRTYSGYVDEASQAVAYVTKKHVFDNLGNTIRLPSDYEQEVRAAVRLETERTGIDPADPEIEASVQDEVYVGSAVLASDLRKRREVMESAVSALYQTDPSVFEELLQDAVMELSGAILDGLSELPPRPLPESQSRKVLRTAGRMLLSRTAANMPDVETHDGKVRYYLGLWKAPNPRQMIRTYVRDELVRAAKEAFGDSGRPIRLNAGLQSDSLDLFDAVQAEEMESGETEAITLAVHPSEYMREASARRIDNLLHGNTPIGRLIRQKMSDVEAEDTSAAFGSAAIIVPLVRSSAI